VQKVIDEGRVPDSDRVRFEMFKRLGYFVTESSEHFAEYTPWFIKHDRPDLIEKYNIPLDEYIRRCEVQIAGWDIGHGLLLNPETEIDLPASIQRLKQAGATDEEILMFGEILRGLDEPTVSHEYGSYIIHSMETGVKRVVYGNVMNDGLIDNLPPESCVEVPCLVDKNGLQPTHVGPLPAHLAGLIQTNINVQKLTVEAALTRKRAAIYHAAMLDPHTTAELDLEQIWDLVDAIIVAHGDWLPEFQ
jgi:alpha-galactosidase